MVLVNEPTIQNALNKKKKLMLLCLLVILNFGDVVYKFKNVFCLHIVYTQVIA